MRIDKYLKVTRIIKRRTVAKDIVSAERIYVNDNAVNKVAKYVAKLSHHGLKTSTRFESLIYSRKKKGI